VCFLQIITSVIAVLVVHHWSAVPFRQKSNNSFDILGVLHTVVAE